MMTGADIAALKAYVAGPDGGMQNRDASTVLLHVSHSNLAARFMEIRLDLHVRPSLHRMHAHARDNIQTWRCRRCCALAAALHAIGQSHSQ